MQWIVSKSMDVKITILQVEVARLRPNPWNTNSVGAQNFEKLKGSIEKLGFFKPILARELDGGQFEILGGEHRWRAAMEQGISTVPVISVGKISDLVAKQMSLVDNERYGEDDQVALQRLIEEIQSELDYQLSEIAPYDDELAATLARESAIDLEMLEALSRGDEEPIEKDSREKAERVGAEHQTMRFKVTFDASDRVTETIKSIIKEQAINTGNDMENAGEALVPVWVGQDFNIDPMSSVILQPQPNGELWAVDELVLFSSNTAEVCDELERRFWRWKSQVTIFPDPAGAYRQHARGESDIDIFKEKGFLRVDYPKKHPPIADRVNSVNRMLMSASGETRLYIDPKCKHLIDSLEKVIYKPGSRDMDKSGGIEHSADALGYPVHRRYPVKNRVILGGSR